MNDGSCMMFPNKYRTMARVPRKSINPLSFIEKENELMENYIDAEIENIAILSPKQFNPPKNDEEKHLQGYWNIYFDNAYSKFISGARIFFKSPYSIIYPHAIKLEFPCTNNDIEYQALIQGMNLSLQMKVENFVVTGNYILVINHIKNKYINNK
jgi:hypothetical protein